MAVQDSGDTKIYQNGWGQSKEAYGVVVLGDESGGGSSTTVTPADHSGTIATGSTAQELLAANAERNGFWVQNVSDGDLWINETGTATLDQPSLLIAAGALYEAPAHGIPSGAISIIGATTGQAFSAREW